MKYTEYGYRINPLTDGPGPHWLFLPGGPGLGSEYLIAFCQQLALPGSVSVVDFPMDGTNLHGKLDLQYWQAGLLDLLKGYDKPILVAHRFAAMFAMGIADIENDLSGLVIMNSTTQNTFLQRVSESQLRHQLPDLRQPASAYHLHPSDETYRAFWDAYKHYCFTAAELAAGEKMMTQFAFSNASYHHAIVHFYPHYQCRLMLSDIPVMTIASENDYICQPDIFIRDARFQAPNILNKVIPEAGHCPWVNQIDSVQHCFMTLSHY